MIYCNSTDCEYRNKTEFRAKRYYNGDFDEVTEILPADLIEILPLMPVLAGEGLIILVDFIDAEGWITPYVPNLAHWFPDSIG